MTSSAIEQYVDLTDPEPRDGYRLENCETLRRELAGRTHPQASPRRLFEDLHDVLATVEYPLAATDDLSDEVRRLTQSRQAAEGWLAAAITGGARVELSAADCLALFCLINRVQELLNVTIDRLRVNGWNPSENPWTPTVAEPAPAGGSR